MKLEDIDLFEMNEAFAAQSFAVIRHLNINPEEAKRERRRHCLRSSAGLLRRQAQHSTFHELRRRNKKYGMVTACVGGGQGVAGIYELLR